jgi:hypothetical protein
MHHTYMQYYLSMFQQVPLYSKLQLKLKKKHKKMHDFDHIKFNIYLNHKYVKDIHVDNC